MTEDMKKKMFEKLHVLETLSNEKLYDSHDYYEQANGAFAMLVILGLDKEYINWSVKKERGLS